METTFRPRTVLIATLVVLALFAVAVIGLVAALLTARSASASPMRATTSLTSADAPAAGTISVSGTGAATGTPDALVLVMSVSVSADTVDAALKQANEAASKVHKALKDKGVDGKDLQTSGLSVQPQYDSNGRTVTGYAVEESVTAKIRGLDKAGVVVSAAVGAAGNAARVQSLSLDLSDSSALLAQARADAVKQAKAKAEQYAEAAGRSVGELVSISETTSYNPPMPYATRSYATDAASSVPIEAGSRDVTVTVSAVYALK